MSPQTIVNKALWKQSIKPGSKLFMSIEVPREQERSGRCRLPGCEGRLEDNEEHVKCQACAFECFFLKSSSIREIGPVRKPIIENLSGHELEEDWKRFKHIYQQMELNASSHSHDVAEVVTSVMEPRTFGTFNAWIEGDPFRTLGSNYDRSGCHWSCVSCLRSDIPFWTLTKLCSASVWATTTIMTRWALIGAPPSPAPISQLRIIPSPLRVV